ncbi:hypothetical protein [Halioxenophilus sp. WMMB6]|uniref:hypothetical protein n=1 Tax=Halioxenophilus sp. WMMB6 TaxID=3073815 RepID=UPI00295E67C7|nr:hypothetical protein [Halioxenophilus sp. WMMB6]
MKLQFKIKRRSKVFVGVLSGAAFIALAIWGWGVPIHRVASFFVICMLFLALIIIIAMIGGLLLVLSRQLKKRRNLEQDKR